MGGYGALGVCLDSVAAIQQAIAGTCTLFPLILGGEPKMRIIEVYHNLQVLGKKVDCQSSGMYCICMCMFLCVYCSCSSNITSNSSRLWKL